MASNEDTTPSGTSSQAHDEKKGVEAIATLPTPSRALNPKGPDVSTAWAFYRRIGSPKTVVAPMVHIV